MESIWSGSGIVKEFEFLYSMLPCHRVPHFITLTRKRHTFYVFLYVKYSLIELLLSKSFDFFSTELIQARLDLSSLLYENLMIKYKQMRHIVICELKRENITNIQNNFRWTLLKAEQIQSELQNCLLGNLTKSFSY